MAGNIVENALNGSWSGRFYYKVAKGMEQSARAKMTKQSEASAWSEAESTQKRQKSFAQRFRYKAGEEQEPVQQQKPTMGQKVKNWWQGVKNWWNGTQPKPDYQRDAAKRFDRTLDEDEIYERSLR